MLPLDTPLFRIKGITPRFFSLLQKLGLNTVRHLLYYFPIRYEDYSKIIKIEEVESLVRNSKERSSGPATICATVKKISSRQSWTNRKLTIVEAILEDETGTIEAVWFNQPFITKMLKEGTEVSIAGSATLQNNRVIFSGPTYEVVRGALRHTGRLIPIYSETQGLTSKGIRSFVNLVLKMQPNLEEALPPEILKTHGFPELRKAITDIHFPKSYAEAVTAKKRFAFEDLLLLQLHNIIERLLLAKKQTVSITPNIDSIKTLLSALPFELTNSQKTALWEILQDMEKSHPMNRLLQGDVGSGKTIVAALAAVHTAYANHQSAFMAPTEILAIQHYETFKKFFGSFEGGVALLTSSTARLFYGNDLESEVQKKKLVSDIKRGKIKVVFGTHALIQKSILWHSLAFITVDEQHRFGIEQRAALLRSGNKESKSKDAEEEERKNSEFQIPNFSRRLPHLLSMSATPIPRTLSMTLFGDLDLSLIIEAPKNRKPIKTKVALKDDREKIYAFIREEIEKGRQAFIVCPRIERKEDESNKDEAHLPSKKELRELEMKTVTEEFDKLKKHVFPDLRLAMLHGKLKPREKDTIMKDFKDKKYEVLVSTSVIEVGVDVPNATVMAIENSENFGLAQLYQFKGRVGRGEHESFCFLLTESNNPQVKERLNIVATAKSGFELAEYDLKTRGPGEFLGTSQSGTPDLAMKAVQNPELVKESREAAISIIKEDPSLKTLPILRKKFARFEEKIHWE